MYCHTPLHNARITEQRDNLSFKNSCWEQVLTFLLPLFEILWPLRDVFPCLFEHPITRLLSQIQSQLTRLRFAYFETRGLGRRLRYIPACSVHNVIPVTTVFQPCTGWARSGTSCTRHGTDWAGFGAGWARSGTSWAHPGTAGSF